MSSRISPPKIDVRKASDLFRALRAIAPHYTREWTAKDDDDPGVALLRIYSSIAGGVIDRLNQAPDRNFLAFLDMLGIRLLQAIPAMAPVTFVVADGIEIPFRVPKGTQVSAPENLAFETIEEMLAIPAKLDVLVAIDAANDAIYKPPPGFLERDRAAQLLPPLLVTAFSAAGSKKLQLSPPGQVQPEEFLRIDQQITSRGGSDQCVPVIEVKDTTASDHFVVSDVQGTVVTVTSPLLRDYVEGTEVQRVTRFELFEAKNWQEHSLYLAHSEYFAIKSEAEITFLVTLANPGASLLPLSIAWEFFGETEDKQKEWLPLGVDADGTVGFTQSGAVVLTKPEGEIKEIEIDGRKNRWIRARLNKALPGDSTALPKIESIMIKVSSGGKELPADKAFHNDTPLTPELPFFPFGTEPRIFDRFSIASEEAFSKPGADVTLDLQLDFTDLLGTPIANFHDKKIRAFCHGASGKLIEFQLDPVSSSANVVSHKSPTDRRLVGASVPAVVMDATGSTLGVFASIDDGRIHLRHIPGGSQTAEWIDLNDTDLPDKIIFNPAAVEFNTMWHVFAVSESKVYKLIVNPAAPHVAVVWTPVSGATTPNAASSPSTVVVQTGGGPQLWIAVTDTAGHTWVHNGTTWLEMGTTDQFLAQPNARPSLAPSPAPPAAATHVRAFIASASGSAALFEIEISNPANLTPTVISQPTPDISVASNVSALSGTQIYVRGSDNQLWNRDLASSTWTQILNLLDAELAGDPLPIEYQLLSSAPSKLLSVLSASNKNQLLEFRAGSQLETGTLKAGPKSILRLRDLITNPSEHFILIVAGPGRTNDNKLIAIEHEADFAVLASELSDVPTEDTQYQLFKRLEPDGQVVTNAGNNDIKLESGTLADVGKFVFVGDQFRQILSIVRSASGDTATISGTWDTNPQQNDPYTIVDKVIDARNARLGSAKSVAFSAGAAMPSTDYPGLFLTIAPAAGPTITGKIAQYLNVVRGVELESNLAATPVAGDNYSITVGEFANRWQSYSDPNQTELRPELSWEYFDGNGWVHLPSRDTTQNFLVPGTVKFAIPADITKTEVAGQNSFWIRARIVGGDYGRELFKFDEQTKQITIEKDPIRPPRILKLGITYDLTEEKPPQVALTFNNLNYLDQTAANVTEDKKFEPFSRLPDSSKALYFGFDRTFRGGPVKIYFAASELPVDERSKPKLEWTFAFANNWKALIVDDQTAAFTRPDYTTLIIPEEIENRQLFGKGRFWLRAALVENDWSKSPLFSGVFVNTVETQQARTVRNEILGSSTGEANQKFNFQQVPVIEGEVVRVREALTDQERQELIDEFGQDVVFAITDNQNRILETWIRWTEVQEFFATSGDGRNYRLDRHTGEIEFGDGIQGRIPPPGGDNIQAFNYQAGGGAIGNVATGEINTPVTAVAGVDSVINPVPAGGGSDAATNDDMLVIGPAQISNRGRAVTPDDFERLALEASREVRKARCLPNRNANGRHESGWTTVYIVPDSDLATPTPTLQLRRQVERYLARRADLTIVDQEHIVVGPPRYVRVSVRVKVFAKTIDDVAKADQEVKKQLDEFLHPLRGGPHKEGWEFGRDLAVSDLYAVLEGIKEVDHIESLVLSVNNREAGEHVDVPTDALIASGNHTVTTVALENG